MRQGCRESQRSYLGRPVIEPKRQPCSREQAEMAGVSRGHTTESFFFREGLNKERDEYDEQFAG
jgi:hypothetical protein